MYKVAICEDEPLILEHTRVLCESILNELEVEHEIFLFTSAEAVEAVLDEKGDFFHLLVLDIQLGEKSGLTLAKELYDRNSEIGIILRRYTVLKAVTTISTFVRKMMYRSFE